MSINWWIRSQGGRREPCISFCWTHKRARQGPRASGSTRRQGLGWEAGHTGAEAQQQHMQLLPPCKGNASQGRERLRCTDGETEATRDGRTGGKPSTPAWPLDPLRAAGSGALQEPAPQGDHWPCPGGILNRVSRSCCTGGQVAGTQEAPFLPQDTRQPDLFQMLWSPAVPSSTLILEVCVSCGCCSRSPRPGSQDQQEFLLQLARQRPGISW